jgi:hypothetical protein
MGDFKRYQVREQERAVGIAPERERASELQQQALRTKGQGLENMLLAGSALRAMPSLGILVAFLVTDSYRPVEERWTLWSGNERWGESHVLRGEIGETALTRFKGGRVFARLQCSHTRD